MMLRSTARWVVMLSSLCTGGSLAAQPSEPRDRTYRVNLFPQGQEGTGEAITISFVGRAFGEDVSTAAIGAQEEFVRRVIEVNKSGSLEDVLQLWPEDERAEVRRMASDKNVWNANRAFYDMIKETRFVARIGYGNYQIVLVRHLRHGEPAPKTYPLKKVGAGAYALTNKLSSDPVFAHIVSTFGFQVK